MKRLSHDRMPRLDDSCIIPARLKRLVELGSNYRLLSITGPSGSGRTTLLTYYAERLSSASNASIIWIDMSISRNGDLVEQLLSEVSSNGNHYIILDNADSSEAANHCDFIQNLIDSAPMSTHFAIAGLREPCITVSRLRLAGNLIEIDRDDLALTISETAIVVKAISPNASEALVKTIYTQTKGWVSGIRMFAMHWQEDPLIKYRSPIRTWASDFAREEIMPNIPNEATDILWLISLFDSFNGEMASALSGQSGCSKLLHLLYAQNLIIPTAAPNSSIEEEWYCCHPLFLPFVRSCAHEHLEKSARNKAISSGIDWLNNHGLYMLSLRTALEYKRHRDALRILLDNLFPILSDCDSTELQQIIKEISCPEGSGDDYLYLYFLVNAWAYFICGKTKRATIWLRKAEAISKECEYPVNHHGMSYVFRTIEVGTKVFAGLYEEAIAKGADLLEVLGGPQLFMRCTIMHNMGEAYERLGKYRDAYEYFTRAKAIANICGRRSVALLCDSEITWLLFIEGRLDAASSVTMRALHSCLETELGNQWAIGVLNVSLARIYLQWGEVDTTRRYLAKANNFLNQDCNSDGFLEASITDARCMILDGDYEGANEKLIECYEIAHLDQTPRGIDLLLLITLSDNLIDMSMANRAKCILEEAEKRMNRSDYFYRIHANLVWSRILVGEGNIAGAEKLIRESLSCALDNGLLLQASDCKARLACILRLSGEKEESTSLMIAALEESAAENRVYLFRKAMPFMNTLLYEIANPHNSNRVLLKDRSIAQLHAQIVLKKLNEKEGFQQENRTTDSNRELERLSDREQEIYRLLQQGKTRKEIASELGITVNTVRTHTKNIYRKTGAHAQSELGQPRIDSLR